VFCSSADWLIRNLHKRVETAFPVLNFRLKRRVTREGLRYYMRDTEFAWRLLPGGGYKRVHPRSGQPVFSSQKVLLGELAVAENE
ncbi:MAG: hypothetical protein Q9M27_02965, partial [Mariprofundaceae bacterium]|nr:hypothetical protein [Mariprofundaceae bacterium]